MSPAERLLARTLLWTSVGVACAFPALVIPAPDDPRLTVVIHLALLGAFALALTFHLAPLGDEPWFGGGGLGVVGRTAATWLTMVATVTASAATVAAATSVALRYDPSTQYLVVLAADAVALPVAMAVLGGRRRFGPGTAAVVAGVLAAATIWSVWRYLDRVGVGEHGAWIVDGSQFGSLVLPVLAGTAVIALTVLTLGTRRR